MFTILIASIISRVCEPLTYLLSIFTGLSAYDLIFIFTAIAFNLIIAGIFIATKLERPKARQTLGIVFMLLTFPLAIVFIRYLIEGLDLGILIRFGLVFLYLLIEFLLDYALKFDFRTKWITHVPYIILEYLALFSLIGIASDINRTWGWIVGIAFWILIACLIYLYWDQITRRKKKDN
jgi:hypothetical protein